MSVPNRQFDARFAKTIAHTLVRLWPAESKDWGRAFEAEFSAIETRSASNSWLIGGVMLLLRERWKHFLRSLGRPIGTDDANSSEFAAKNYSRVPRTPLWASALLLLATTALLFHPEVRTALGGLYSTYAHTEREPSRWSSVKKLRTLASTNRDPQLLAILSLLSTDDSERLALSDEAIQKDSSLTWLDYEQSLLPLNDLSHQRYSSETRLARLQNWDPQNAIPHLLVAEELSQPLRTEAFDALMHGNTNQAWGQKIAQDADWMAEMSTAFSAPKYDNYATQLLGLIRNVNEKFAVRDPDIALFILSSKRNIQFDVVQVYAGMLLNQGTNLAASGNSAQAEVSFTAVLNFSQRMLLGYQFPFEDAFAKRTGSKAAEKLRDLYRTTGRTNEAALLTFQLAEWNKSRDAKLMRYLPLQYREAQWSSLAWSGLQINLAGITLLLFAPLALLSVIRAWWRRSIPSTHRGRLDFWASISVDGLPWILLAQSALLYIAYHPYARICADALNPNRPLPELETFVTAALVTHAVPDRIALIRDPFSLWFAITALLCLIAAWLIYRLAVCRSHSL